eukprot:TRINITY_DN27055_c0_g1_i1.p1 TRINITY_DN27055_c0_g1~~TRINITY_DN27055_c0_g1_i1.p1  ORF type:complete len:1683 (+),score=361.78 TRINITY_DN27055_c0_g1_i1:363-5051(+)
MGQRSVEQAQLRSIARALPRQSQAEKQQPLCCEAPALPSQSQPERQQEQALLRQSQSEKQHLLFSPEPAEQLQPERQSLEEERPASPELPPRPVMPSMPGPPSLAVRNKVVPADGAGSPCKAKDLSGTGDAANTSPKPSEEQMSRSPTAALPLTPRPPESPRKGASGPRPGVPRRPPPRGWASPAGRRQVVEPPTASGQSIEECTTATVQAGCDREDRAPEVLTSEWNPPAEAHTPRSNRSFHDVDSAKSKLQSDGSRLCTMSDRSEQQLPLEIDLSQTPSEDAHRHTHSEAANLQPILSASDDHSPLRLSTTDTISKHEQRMIRSDADGNHTPSHSGAQSSQCEDCQHQQKVAEHEVQIVSKHVTPEFSPEDIKQVTSGRNDDAEQDSRLGCFGCSVEGDQQTHPNVSMHCSPLGGDMQESPAHGGLRSNNSEDGQKVNVLSPKAKKVLCMDEWQEEVEPKDVQQWLQQNFPKGEKKHTQAEESELQQVIEESQQHMNDASKQKNTCEKGCQQIFADEASQMMEDAEQSVSSQRGQQKTPPEHAQAVGNARPAQSQKSKDEPKEIATRPEFSEAGQQKEIPSENAEKPELSAAGQQPEMKEISAECTEKPELPETEQQQGPAREVGLQNSFAGGHQIPSHDAESRAGGLERSQSSKHQQQGCEQLPQHHDEQKPDEAKLPQSFEDAQQQAYAEDVERQRLLGIKVDTGTAIVVEMAWHAQDCHLRVVEEVLCDPLPEKGACDDAAATPMAPSVVARELVLPEDLLAQECAHAAAVEDFPERNNQQVLAKVARPQDMLHDDSTQEVCDAQLSHPSEESQPNLHSEGIEMQELPESCQEQVPALEKDHQALSHDTGNVLEDRIFLEARDQVAWDQERYQTQTDTAQEQINLVEAQTDVPKASLEGQMRGSAATDELQNDDDGDDGLTETDSEVLQAAQEAEEAARLAQEALEVARLAQQRAAAARKNAQTKAGRQLTQRAGGNACSTEESAKSSGKLSSSLPAMQTEVSVVSRNSKDFGEPIAEIESPEASEPLAQSASSADSGSPTDVLFVLDTSFSMHAPEQQANRPVATWSEDDWDSFGRHLRTRSQRCLLEPLGIHVLSLLASATRGLAVEVRLCGEDGAPGECKRHCPLDEHQLGRHWRRTLCRGADVWRNLSSDIDRLKPKRLQSVVVVTGTDTPCEPPGSLFASLASTSIPVHVLSLAEAVSTRNMAASVASASSGISVQLDFSHGGAGETPPAALKKSLQHVLGSLLELKRPTLAASDPDPAVVRCRAARLVQRAVRPFLKHRQMERCMEAVERISRAYGCYRWRKSFVAAVQEARRARRRAPVEEALQRRAAQQSQQNRDAAVRRIQAEWRARRMRIWCRRIDRAARCIQGWMKRRWMCEKLEAEAQRLINRRGQKVAKPPPPPSKWPHNPAAVFPSADKAKESSQFPSGSTSPSAGSTSPRALFTVDEESAPSSPSSASGRLQLPAALKPASNRMGSGTYYTASAPPQRLPSPASAQAAGRSLAYFSGTAPPGVSRHDKAWALRAASSVNKSKTMAAVPRLPSSLRRAVDAAL